MENKIFFVMMPFGGDFEDYYKEIYHSAIEECDLLPRRADSIYRPSPILHDIWSFVNDSALVIADITGRNPNVMYELGLAHAIAKPAIIISNNIEDVPFDLRALRILLYNTNKPNWATELKKAIVNSIKEIINSPSDAVLPTFLNVTSSKQEEVSEVKKDLIEIKQYLYRLNLEDTGDEYQRKPKILSSEEYGEAIQDAHKLYYDQGLDMLEIKSYLLSKYGMGTYSAQDIISIVRRG
jgi:hypothetical protein